MKLLRYGEKGRERPGMLDAGGRVRDLSGVVPDLSGEVLTRAGLARLAALDPASLPLVEGEPQNGLRLGQCVAGVGKFIAIGLNYSDHAAETGSPVPKEPIVFGKWITCLSGPDDDIVMPKGSTKTDWEVELGIVIGDGGTDPSEAEALDAVAGWCVVNDVSEREWQIERGGTWDKGKGFDSFGPVGPWLVTRDEIPEPGNLRLWLEVDGRRMQDGSTGTMIFDAATLVSYCSRIMRLMPGDIIATGTPPGVGLGMKPPRYLQGGETIRLGIDGLGQQTQRVRKS